ncbi:uncharacterized protein TNCV_2229111 [Trichonephila clavipes]|nr:uncharacterized protein TNCV_2229111 [Trichonephila clavipes]
MIHPSRWISHMDPVLKLPRSPGLTPLDFFSMGQYQGIGAWRSSDYTNELICSSACCLHFGGQRVAETLGPSQI